MIERRILVPVVPEALWEALTDPDEVGAWFGHEVEWELVPGGRARWTAGAGDRLGVVEEVTPLRRLRFRWWPESGDGPASEVIYELEPAGDDDAPAGTRLTVRESPIAAPSVASAASASAAAGRWTVWDRRSVGLWMRLHSPARVAA